MTAPQRTAESAGTYSPTAVTPRFIWHDLMTTDMARSRKWYAALFGWTYEELDMGPAGTYPYIVAGERRIGGMMQLEAGSHVPPHWMGYVSVADVDATCRRAPQLGGSVVVPPTDIPNVGRFAILRDPQGADFAAIWVRDPAPDPAPDAPVLGTVTWNELLTPDPALASGFYGALLGWTIRPMEMGPMGTYWIFSGAGTDRGGILRMPDEATASPFWLPYIAVASCDATARQVETLGGKLFVQPTDVPGVGRFAVAADFAGVSFAVLQRAQA